MKLSLMMLNLTRSVFMDEHFQQRQKVDPAEYENALKLAHQVGYTAVDLSNMEFEVLGVDTVKALLQKYQLQCASMILFENFTCCDEKEQERVKRHTEQLIDAAQVTECPNLMLVAAGVQPGIDTGWLVYAGIDAVSYIRENIERIAILHFKDICKGYENMDRSEIFAACGEGVVGFAGILNEITEEKKKSILYVLDQDDSKQDIVEDHVRSMEYLRGLEMQL